MDSQTEMVLGMMHDQMLRAAEDTEADLDQKLKDMDAMKQDDIEEIRRKRLEQMKSTYSRKNKMLAQGHGEYSLIDEKDFFDAAKKSDYIVVHFYRPSTWRCEILDRHMKQLAVKHWGTRFVKIDAEKSRYLVERLRIWCMPSLVLCKHGKTEKTIAGFDEFGGGDEFTTEMMEKVLAEYGVIEESN
eukprot:gnl/MRDRNA2_/MRDRNA2_87445_c0_seq1.p1 gnl/MRDRNA2_/MRDRNA2_87445_c0~~gnl/MRDRNA2_/MRDRNA2_87445_c0_seq1.p1  ORF type:complete len:213 (-),score=57.46 gnl/MRDRNA2_/MRDRNA2_87445_c0_seq1:234-794(-)